MPTLNEVTSDIYTYFINEWTGTSEFTFDNEEYTPPKDQAWVRLSVRSRTSIQDTLGRTGNRQYERRGAVMLQIFTPLNQGRKQADVLVQKFQEIFEGVNLNGVNFYEVPFNELGAIEEYYRVDIEALFVYNETK